MRLYLVQHGEAVAREVDPDRPLSDRGRADVERLAAFLQQSGIRVARVLHSGKRRAAQTAERLAAALAPGVAPEPRGGIDPDDDPRAFDWQRACGDQDTLVVGHLPHMARLVALLVTGQDAAAVAAYRPGSVVCLERNDSGRWQIEWMLRPELLKRE
jgi:phosphohistidine phosphatase